MDQVNAPEGSEIDKSEPKNLTEAKDKYVADKLRDMLYNMKETKTPKGVWFSTFVMSVPLVGATGYLAALSPVVGISTVVDPHSYAYVARTCVRLLSLNISFFGGIHYGLASATYDTARDPEEQRAVTIQMMYSFFPALMSFSASNFLLFSSPLGLSTVVYAFTSLMITQLLSLKFDTYCVKKEMAPMWFKKYRTTLFWIYMGLTTTLFAIYYTNLEWVQRTNDPNRISNLKTVLELEDTDFIKMVDEMKLELNETDLRDIEK